MKIIASIQARMGSTRLPGKVLLPLGDERVLEWVVKRCEESRSVDKIVVTTGDQPENQAIREWCRRNGVPNTYGPEKNLLARHLKNARETNADVIVRITGDCPFVPPEEIERILGEHQRSNARYTTNVTPEMPVGTATDLIDIDVLEDLDQLGETHPTELPRKQSNEWKTRFSPSERWCTVGSAHIAVDTPIDYWRLEDAITEVGSEPHDVAKWVAQNNDKAYN